jgi:hypothetical protein
MSPASNAASATVSLLAGFPQVAARIRFDTVEAVAEVDLIQIELEDHRPWSISCSMWAASTTSFIFRRSVLSRLRKLWRASCWVIVLPPSCAASFLDVPDEGSSHPDEIEPRRGS